jgi:hypothetical protein
MSHSASSKRTDNQRRRRRWGALPALALCLAPSASSAQLANPGFETPGASTEFDAWGQFGSVDTAFDLRADGARSAKVWGPFASSWALSGVYQGIGVAPGQFVVATVHAGHPASDPLTGLARAILNVEWRDAGDTLIAYDTFDLFGAAAPTDAMTLYTRVAGPAPPGATTARLVLGVLQSPANETGSARFDLASLTNDPDAVHDAIQWLDFGDRTIEFAGLTWRCKAGPNLGPGPNAFSDSEQNVWTDEAGRLHLRITNDAGQWQCPEIAAENPLGHGDYVFVTRGRIDNLDPNLVLAMFIWEYQESYAGSGQTNVANEFDIELSRWTDPFTPLNAQFVAQPYTTPGNLSRFTLELDSPNDLVSHAFLWREGQVVCRTWHGDAPEPTPETLIHQFNYTGPDVPRDEAPRVHFNFWLVFGNPPMDAMEREAVFETFRFVPPPACPGDLNDDASTDVFDFASFVASFGTSVPALTAGDLDGNGAVDVLDFAILAADFGCQ